MPIPALPGHSVQPSYRSHCCQIDMYWATTIVRQFEHCFVQHDIIGPFILCVMNCRDLNAQLCHIVLDFSSINYLCNILSDAPYMLS